MGTGPGKEVITCKVNDDIGVSASCKVNVVAVSGQSYTVGKYRYKVIDANVDGTGTVVITGSTSNKTKTIIVGNTVKIGDKIYKITSINVDAFKKYKNLTSVIIGANINTIASNAFNGDKKLKSITIKSKALKKVGRNAIKGINYKAKIKVPKSKFKVYKKIFNKSTGFKKTMKIKK